MDWRKMIVTAKRVVPGLRVLELSVPVYEKFKAAVCSDLDVTLEAEGQDEGIEYDGVVIVPTELEPTVTEEDLGLAPHQEADCCS